MIFKTQLENKTNKNKSVYNSVELVSEKERKKEREETDKEIKGIIVPQVGHEIIE